MSNNEILFWKVIKNVVLFKIIFSNINEYSKFKYGVYKYHQIISVEDMIENKNFNELLKYKVKRNEHLSFTYLKMEPTLSRYLMITEPPTNLNYRIYSTIKDDQEFYHCLFKFYPDQFEKDLSKENVKSTVYKMIEYDCLGGLMELIDTFYFGKSVSEKHYKMAFNFNSFKVLEYLHMKFKFKIIPLKYYDEIKKNTPNHSISKIKKIFYKGDGLPMKFLNVNGQVGFLINVLGYSKPKKSDILFLIYAINQDIWEITLQQLIDTCITVSFLEVPLNSFIKSIKQFTGLLNDAHLKDIIDLYLNHINNVDQQQLLSIDEINLIKSNFTNEQLSNKLETIESNQVELGQLFKFILPFIGYGELLFSNLRYYYIKFIKPIDQLGILPYNPLRFKTIYKYFQFTNSKQEKYKYLKTIVNEYKLGHLEKAATNPHILKMKKQLQILLLEGLLNIFIEQEDHKCLELVLDLMGSNDISVFMVSRIPSKETFQLIYNHHNCDIKKLITKIISYYIEILNPKVMEYYHSLYPLEYQELINKANNLTLILDSLTPKSAYFINGLETNGEFNEELCWFIYNNECLLKKFVPILNLKLSYQLFKYFFQNTYSRNPPSESLSYTDKLIYIEFTRIEKINLYHYLCNDYDRLFSDKTNPTFFFENSKLLFSVISQYGDVNGLSKILSTYFPSHSYTDNLQFIPFLDTFYVFSCFFNQISIIDFIHSNYPYLSTEIDTRTIEFCMSTIKNNSQRSKLLNTIKK